MYGTGIQANNNTGKYWLFFKYFPESEWIGFTGYKTLAGALESWRSTFPDQHTIKIKSPDGWISWYGI